MRPKCSTGYLTPQTSKSKNASKLGRTASNENLNMNRDLSDSFFQKLMSCPIKRQLVLHLIDSEKDNIKEYKRKQSKAEKLKENQRTSLSKIRNYNCESPTALFRRRALEKQNHQNVLCEGQEKKNYSDSSSQSNSRQSDTSSCPSPILSNKLLDGVIAYVEVKSKGQDRSNGAKALMRFMGATIKDTFTKDVTHVIFKDGSFSTYQKAKLMKVHLVSVLWIDAVRSSNMKVSEKKFPALGTEPYNSNISVLCSQMQKDYEEIIRDELRLSLATGTPLPSTQTIIDRRRTIMTPIPFSPRGSSENISSQDKEVEKILQPRRRTYNFISCESSPSDKLSSGSLSDDDSDLGPFIDGKIIKRENDSLFRDLLASSSRSDSQKQLENSNMELTTPENVMPSINSSEVRGNDLSHSGMDLTSLDEVSNSNVPPLGGTKKNYTRRTTSNESIYYKKTPKKRPVMRIVLENNTFDTPDDSLYKRKTRPLSNDPKVFKGATNKSKLHAKSVNISTDKALLELSHEGTNIHILSKNVCNTNTTSRPLPDSTSNVNLGKSSSTNMSSLQISDRNEKPEAVTISTSSSMSALLISTDSSKDKTTPVTKHNNLKKHDDNISELNLSKESILTRSMSKGKDSFSPINSNLVDEILELLDEPSPKYRNITRRGKRNSLEMGRKYSTRRRTALPLDMETRVSLKDIEDMSKQLEDNSVSVASSEESNSSNKCSKNKAATPKDAKIKSNKRNENAEQLKASTNTSVTPKKTSKKSRLSTNTKGTFEERHSRKNDNLMECSSGDKNMKKGRKLYDPDESIKEMVENDDSERKQKRTEVQKRKSNEGVVINLQISNISSLTPNSKALLNDNNLEPNDESETKLRKKRKLKKDAKKNISINSESDEQHQLAEEFVNKKKDEKLDNVATKPSTNEIQNTVVRRKSVRLSQHPRTKFNTDGSMVASSDDKKTRITETRNRRSTMEFQTKSQMSLNRKLKIDCENKRPSIVCTKFHKEEIQTLNQIVRKLGVFIVKDEVCGNTTHLVAAEPKRTINMLRALARGLWILKREWVLKSLEEGRWLPEEDYEETDFSRAVQESRLRRQAFGPSYTMDVFQDCGPIYIAKGTIPRCSDLTELVSLCKGTICNIPRNAAIVVGEHIRHDEVKCVEVAWVLDCITFNKRLSLRKYIMSTNSNAII